MKKETEKRVITKKQLKDFMYEVSDSAVQDAWESLSEEDYNEEDYVPKCKKCYDTGQISVGGISAMPLYAR